MSEHSAPAPPEERKTRRALELALILTAVAVVLAIPLLIKENAYNFVIFTFLAPPLLVVAALALGWVIFQELRHKKVL